MLIAKMGAKSEHLLFSWIVVRIMIWHPSLEIRAKNKQDFTFIYFLLDFHRSKRINSKGKILTENHHEHSIVHHQL